MKNIFLFLVFYLCSGLLFAQDQTVKFYLDDNSFKTYNIEDIENISLIKAQSDLEMKIFLQGSLSESYPLVNIDSMKFESVDDIIRNLVIYVAGSEPQSHLLADIDSIIFSQTSAPAPFIESIEFSSAIIGEEVTISGSNFGDTQGESSVTFTGAIATDYTSWEDSEINVIVPMGAQTGYVSVIVNNIISNGKYFKVIPQISEINPTSGEVGDIITISGTGFGPEQATSRVYFGDIQADEFLDWNETEIKVKVPAEATSGKVYIRIKSLSSNEVDFTVIEIPTITAINPTSFTVGSDVTIEGSGFGFTQNGSTVAFNTIQATSIKYWNNSEIRCTVPIGATSGNLSVTVNSVKSNEMPYTIIELIETVLISSGSFQMGNTGSWPSSVYQPETPVHQVTIRNDFYMSKYEVLQDLYTTVMGNNPSNNKGDNLPVDRVSWYLAVEFCNKLSDMDGLDKCYTINGTSVSCNWNAGGWRLPTEAEWEYACKAGTSSDFYTGSSESGFADAAWYSGNSGEISHPVGQKTPNSFSLYDMHGNLSELCWDWIGPYSGGSQTDPTGPSSGTWKVARGGSWHNGAANSRSSMRGWIDAPDMQSSAVGFRIVRLK
ncbi:SUMF1/EgtB/PvdO family nonheme iron enzyme [Bacteroidota bacterium]